MKTTCLKGSLLIAALALLISNCSTKTLDAPVTMTALRAARPPGGGGGNAPTICDYNPDDVSLTGTGWTKIFEEEFSGDLSKWSVWTGGAYNNELQFYQPGNLQLQNGVLLISAKKETVTGPATNWDATPKTFQYTSGRIECKTNISASSSTPKIRMAARIKLPAGYGLWPAFWSYGDPWPTQGEIDYLEARSQTPNQYETNYFYGNREGSNLVRRANTVITADADLTQCFHVFEMIWEQNKLTALLDGKVVEEKTSGGYISAMFGKQQRITLNLAVGGDFFSKPFDPAKITNGTMAVDWVKVFTSN